MDPAFTMTRDDHENERLIVAQWIKAHPESLRILDVESPAGLVSPGQRIPELSELIGTLDQEPTTGDNATSNDGATTGQPGQFAVAS